MQKSLRKSHPAILFPGMSDSIARLIFAWLAPNIGFKQENIGIRAVIDALCDCVGKRFGSATAIELRQQDLFSFFKFNIKLATGWSFGRR